MKRFFWMVLLCALSTTICYSQRAYVENVNGVNLYVIDAVGMPQGAAKSAAEVTASKTTGGRLYRHTEKGGSGSNPDVNAKISPKFAVAPNNIDVNGNGIATQSTTISWAEAAGWNTGADTNNDATATTANTGCYMYKGPAGTDPLGTWRLPTQRELALVWVLNERIAELGMTLISGTYHWTATESSYTVNSVSGAMMVRFDGGTVETQMKPDNAARRVRCVRDL